MKFIWARMRIFTRVASRKFSKGRTIAEYNNEIRKLESVSPAATDPGSKPQVDPLGGD